MTLMLGIFIFGLIIQFIYLIFLFGKLSLHKESNRNFSEKPAVSVIICARNEAENLKENLGWVLEQKYDEFEVVVVNHKSKDDTKKILNEFKKRYKNLNVLFFEDSNKLSTKKDALAFGIQHSKHQWVLLTDADCKPKSKYWIEKMTQSIDEKTKIVLGYGAYENQPTFLNKLIHFDTFYTALQYLSFALAGKPYMGVGRNLLYNKTLFEKVDGFNNHKDIQSGDDDLFINSAATSSNTSICIHPDAFTVSKPKTSFKEWAKQKTRHFSTGFHYKFKTKTELGLFFLSFYCFLIGFIGCVVSKNKISWILTAFILRYLLQLLVFLPAMKKLQERKLWVYSPFIECLAMILYPIFSIKSKLTQEHQWK